MKKAFLASYAFIALTPMLALAQFGRVDDFVEDISSFINDTLIPLLFAVALLFFLFGMFKYFIQGKNQADSKEEGKSYIIWSIVGFVMMIIVFGVVNLIASSTGLDDETIDNIPNIPTTNR